jgi:hypothetical protein
MDKHLYKELFLICGQIFGKYVIYFIFFLFSEH